LRADREFAVVFPAAQLLLVRPKQGLDRLVLVLLSIYN
jgi:hypothetical protein